MSQFAGSGMASAEPMSLDLAIVCLWSTIGLLLTEAMFAHGFGADLVQALLMAG